MGELGALFNPGMRHEIEERESKQNRREEEGNARDGDLRIDLTSGVAVINIPGRPAGSAESEGQGGTGAPNVARTVGEKPSAAATTRRNAHLRAQERKAGSTRNGRSQERTGNDHVGTSERPVRSDKSNTSDADAPRTTPAPSSKASRTAR